MTSFLFNPNDNHLEGMPFRDRYPLEIDTLLGYSICSIHSSLKISNGRFSTLFNQ